MTVTPLSDEDIQRRLAEVQGERADAQAAQQAGWAKDYRYVKPFSSTYDGILEALEGGDDRFRLGLAPIDVLTRGFGPKELVFVTGFSHSGKTQLVNTAILHNTDKRILFFSMDDPAEMILMKLVCMHEGVSAEVLERRIRQHDAAAKASLKAAATGLFRNLVVIDESLGLEAMTRAIAEATDYWKAPPQLVVIDYLELMQGDAHSDDAGGNVKSKSQALKKWVKDKPFPTMVLHQGTRGRCAPGEPITMLSMAYGGEQEGTVVIGARRKREYDQLDSWERDQHKNTITLHVVKNKRPPAKITPRDGIDFFMDPDTGIIRQLREDDLHPAAPSPTTSRPVDTSQALSSAEEALRAARERQAALDD